MVSPKSHHPRSTAMTRQSEAVTLLDENSACSVSAAGPYNSPVIGDRTAGTSEASVVSAPQIDHHLTSVPHHELRAPLPAEHEVRLELTSSHPGSTLPSTVYFGCMANSEDTGDRKGPVPFLLERYHRASAPPVTAAMAAHTSFEGRYNVSDMCPRCVGAAGSVVRFGFRFLSSRSFIRN